MASIENLDPLPQGIPAGRNVAIDLLRWIAMFGVVAMHVNSSSASESWNLMGMLFWPWAVSFFYLVSLRFFLVKMWVEPASVVLSKQFQRLIIPFLTWTAIYVSAQFLKSFLNHQPRAIDWIGVIVYGQSAVQLYFLPILISLQSITLCIYLLRARNQRNRVIASFSLIALFALVCWGRSQSYFGWEGYLVQLPLFLLAAWFLASPPRWLPTRALFVSGIALLIAASLLNVMGIRLLIAGFPGVFFLGGFGACLIGSNWKVTLNNWWEKWIFSTSYGIYLSHFLFIQGFEIVLAKIGNPFPVAGVLQYLTLTVGAFLLGMLFTHLVRKVSFLRSVLLGESAR